MSFLAAWWIFTRKDSSRWIALIVVFLCLYLTWSGRTWGVSRWTDITRWVAQSQPIIAIAFIGWSAWRGRIERASGIQELTQSASRTASKHIAIVALSTTFWAISAFAVHMVIVFAVFGWQTTWGGPDVSVLIAAMTSVAALALLGLFVGWLLPYLVIPVCLPIAFWYLDGILALKNGWLAFVVPRALYENLNLSIFSGAVPQEIPLLQTFLWIAIAVTSLAACIWVTQRSVQAIFATVLLLVLSTVFPLYAIYDAAGSPADYQSNMRSFEWDCRADLIVVCLHPANSALMDDVYLVLEMVALPILRAQGDSFSFQESAPNQVEENKIYVSTGVSDGLNDYLLAQILPQMVQSRTAFQDAVPLTWSQAVVAGWLAHGAGAETVQMPFLYMSMVFAAPSDVLPGVQESEYLSAIEALSSLPQDQMDIWIRTNWQDIKSGLDVVLPQN